MEEYKEMRGNRKKRNSRYREMRWKKEAEEEKSKRRRCWNKRRKRGKRKQRNDGGRGEYGRGSKGRGWEIGKQRIKRCNRSREMRMRDKKKGVGEDEEVVKEKMRWIRKYVGEKEK